MTTFSILDQGPVGNNASPRRAIRDCVDVAASLDGLGYARYWVAEHHGTASRAISAPEILIAGLAEATAHLRVGAGGIMLPNHAPMHVAEQFRLLEALYPGRIDLGIGRSSGTIDAATASALARGSDSPEGFARELGLVLEFGAVPAGTGIQVMPDDVPLPPVYLLGTSPASAELAARLGLRYALSAGFRDPAVVAQVLRHYRASFVPTRPGDRPYAMLVLRAWVGEDDEHGKLLAAPERLANVQQLAGHPAPLMPAEAALAHPWTEAERRVGDRLDLRSDIAGGPEHVRDRIVAVIAASDADEIMIVANTYSPGERVGSFRRFAEVMGFAGDRAGLSTAKGPL
jgi:luciferase family oxidoreductase group 1